MQKIVTLLLLSSALVISTSSQAQDKAKWKEMEEFHKVMSTTFHTAEEGKLEPIKTRSQEMIDKAVAWQKSTAPQGYDKKAVSSSLKRLVKGSKQLHSMIQAKAGDNEIKEKLSSLHDVFHE